MPDMLVKLYHLPEMDRVQMKKENYQIRRAMSPDKRQVVDWVKEHSGVYAAGECDVCFSHTPISCFIATREEKIIGYACYDATAPDFFGPTRVLDEEQGKGIGKQLLLASLWAMREEGYGYGIIGSVGPAAFYEKCVGATIIPDSSPGIYKDFLGGMEKRKAREEEKDEDGSGS